MKVLLFLALLSTLAHGYYLTHALAGEVCADDASCLRNLPHQLKRMDRKIFLQRPTRFDRYVSNLTTEFPKQYFPIFQSSVRFTGILEV